MEFNAGIFPFTGTRSNPLNMFRHRELTLAKSRTAAAQAAAMASRSALFPSIIRGWSGLELPLTRRQDEIGEDPTGEGNRTKTSGKVGPDGPYRPRPIKRTML